MLGSAFEAEDAVQETMVRAWRASTASRAASALRSWLYRIATNVCLDMLNGRKRRARPMDLGDAGTRRRATLHDAARGHVDRADPRRPRAARAGDPAELARRAETIRLAFVAALQHLPARQRAVLILREVLRWSATEVAELLDTTVASVNSALQRARATLADSALDARATPPRADGRRARELLERYVDAFERYDIDALVALLHEDATLSMPPYDLWLRGREHIAAWMLGPGDGCRGSRLIADRAPTACRRSGSTARAAPAAATSRGRCRCSRSPTGGSPGSTRSSTPSGCSRCSACPPFRPEN